MLLKINANHYHVQGREQENGRKINSRENTAAILIEVVSVVYCPFDWHYNVRLNRTSSI